MSDYECFFLQKPYPVLYCPCSLPRQSSKASKNSSQLKDPSSQLAPLAEWVGRRPPAEFFNHARVRIPLLTSQIGLSE